MYLVRLRGSDRISVLDSASRTVRFTLDNRMHTSFEHVEDVLNATWVVNEKKGFVDASMYTVLLDTRSSTFKELKKAIKETTVEALEHLYHSGFIHNIVRRNIQETMSEQQFEEDVDAVLRDLVASN